MLEIKINGNTHKLDIEPDTPLLWAIRDTIGLTGTKYGCGIQQCGACTVLIKGRPVRSCGMEGKPTASASVKIVEKSAVKATSSTSKRINRFCFSSFYFS